METVRSAVPEVEDRQEEGDDFAPGSRRKTLAKREVEERGLGVVEELLDRGNVVHIVPEGRPGVRRRARVADRRLVGRTEGGARPLCRGGADRGGGGQVSPV